MSTYNRDKPTGHNYIKPAPRPRAAGHACPGRAAAACRRFPSRRACLGPTKPRRASPPAVPAPPCCAAAACLRCPSSCAPAPSCRPRLPRPHRRCLPPLLAAPRLGPEHAPPGSRASAAVPAGLPAHLQGRALRCWGRPAPLRRRPACLAPEPPSPTSCAMER
ncbi:unnamed protein product [Urochloa humidicola]